MERELVCVCKNISSSHLPLEKNIKRKKVIYLYLWKIPSGIFHHRRYFSRNKKKSEKICNLFWQTRKQNLLLAIRERKKKIFISEFL
jgi:hypothetical protein